MSLARQPKGFYIREEEEDGGFRTLWIHDNGYSKKFHRDEYEAVKWLVERGCPMKEGVPDDVKADAKAIRDAWLIYAGHVQAVAPSDKDTSPPAELQESGALLTQSDFSGYVAVVAEPEIPVVPETPQQPSCAPQGTSQTSEKVPEEQHTPALEFEIQCGVASSSPHLEHTEGCSSATMGQSDRVLFERVPKLFLTPSKKLGGLNIHPFGVGLFEHLGVLGTAFAALFFAC